MNIFTISNETKKRPEVLPRPLREQTTAEIPNETMRTEHTSSSKRKSPKKQTTKSSVGIGSKKPVSRESSVGDKPASGNPDEMIAKKKKKKPKTLKNSSREDCESKTPKKLKKKSSSVKSRSNADRINKNDKKKKKSPKPRKRKSITPTEPVEDPLPIDGDSGYGDDKTFVGTSSEDFRLSHPGDDCCETDRSEPSRIPTRRVSFQTSNEFSIYNHKSDDETSLDISFGGDEEEIASNIGNKTKNRDSSVRSLENQAGNPPKRRLSNSLESIRSTGGGSGQQCNIIPDRRRDRSMGHRTAFANSRGKKQNQNFRITTNPTEMRTERIEAFFYNCGMEIALGVLYLALNILVAAHGAYQFTEIGGWKTDDDVLRVTLPIARAGGRLVTLNCAIVLLTGCKYLWTCVRTYLSPVLPIGFPIDNIMPKYHRYVALTVIVSGCIVHTLPQIVNYATRSIEMDPDGIRIWTFGDGFATKQLLLTGTLLTIIFSTFFVTTLKSFRKTAAGFRWFWFFHMGGIATAYPLLLIHGTCRGHPVFLYFALAPLVLYIFDVAMRRSNVSTTNVLEWITHEDKGQQITELIIECPTNFTYTPGQYAELKFSTISSSEWHPFTIASAPNEKDMTEDGRKKIVFHIKNSGRWTEALYNHASAFDLKKARKPTQIQIRGPHGAPAMNYFEYKHIVVIGSGVGVTPLLSIWKFLVAKGKTMVYNPDSNIKNNNNNRSNDSIFSHFHDERTMDDSMKSVMMLDGEGEKSSSRIYAVCVILEKLFESMTVSMSLLVIFVLGETLTFVLQMFGYGVTASYFGAFFSLIALFAHGSTVLVSTVALGRVEYFNLFRGWLECTIIVVDAFAFWFSIVSVQNTTEIAAYFLFFGLVVVLHAIRIFHIFYMTLKPKSSHHVPTKADTMKNASISMSLGGRRSAIDNDEEICSIDGILINRTYSNMKFAARSLLKPIIEDGLADLFSMEFYGTREASKDQNRSEHGLISDMMGSMGRGLDIRSSMCKHQHDEYFHPGRPNWNKIFLKAMAKAHQRNPKGESVGVFFCGSPAIAKDLQAAAAEVTARHQYAVKHLDGKACKCKLIVHSENF